MTMDDFLPGTVYFAGAGPGDVELLTLKARRLLECAELILYAGSLVNPALLEFARPGAGRLDTAGLKLDAQLEAMISAARADKVVARLHTGDPSIFGAIAEQMRGLQTAGIPYQVIPGVSSAFAAAAALAIEYTLPETTQTVIFTRLAGRTPVPEPENLRLLAAHRCSLVIFLSAGLISEVVADLEDAGYDPETPVAVVYRASWPDQQILRGTLATLAAQSGRQELTHQGLIIVSPALGAAQAPRSHLYGGFQEKPSTRQGLAILALTAPAARLGRVLLACLPDAVLYLPQRLGLPEDSGNAGVRLYRESIRQALQGAFARHAALVCIMASGIVVRELAPLLVNKHTDPAVVVMDADGRFAVSLLSGHAGGANALARRLAELTGGQAVVTTASDVQHVPALDVIARQKGWKMHPQSALPAVMAALVDGALVGIVQEGERDWLEGGDEPAWIRLPDLAAARRAQIQALVVLTFREPPACLWDDFPQVVVYHPPALVVGVGCNRHTPAAEIKAAVEAVLCQAGLAPASLACLATVQEKAREPGLVEAAKACACPLKTVTRRHIRQVADLPTPSAYALKALGVPGVAEPAALLVAGSRRLLVEKRKFPNVTVAVALQEAV